MPRRDTPPPPEVFDSKLCHYCHENKLDPEVRYVLPNEIECCKACAERLGAQRAKRLMRAQPAFLSKPAKGRKG